MNFDPCSTLARQLRADSIRSSTVAGVDDLHRLLTGERAGRSVEVRLLREGRRLILRVQPSDRPD